MDAVTGLIVCAVWGVVASLAALVFWARGAGDRAARDELAAVTRQTSARRDELAAELERCQTERDRLYWLEWWTRNACETPYQDAARSLFLRWSIAAHCAPSFDVLHRDLIRIASDANRSETERNAARGFAAELERKEHPWVQWQRETGKPPHNAESLRVAYHAALDGWPALLGLQAR